MSPEPSNPVDELIRLHGAGRFPELQRRTSALLAAQPDTPVLNEFMGIALVAQGNTGAALPYLMRAAERAPAEPQFWENLGLCQRLLKKFSEAEASLQRSLTLRPQSAATLNALGSVQREFGRFEQACASFERALAIEPNSVAVRFNLAKTLIDQGRLDQSEAHLRHAVLQEPGNGSLHHALALVWTAKGEWQRAEEACRHAIEAEPANPRFVTNLAYFLVNRGRVQEAIEAVHGILQQFDAGKIELTDDSADVLNDVGAVLESAGQSEAAVRIYRVTSGIKMNAAMASMMCQSARRVCDWALASKLEPLAREPVEAHSTAAPPPPVNLLNLTSATAGEQLAAARSYAAYVAGGVAAVARPHASAADRIRIGYFSADYYGHAVSLLVAGVIEAHDRSRFDVVAYDFAPPLEDDYRRRMKAAFDRFVRIADMSDREAALAIADDRIDILVDLTGWASGSRLRLLAARPAPVQLHWLGYPGTTGAPWLDYLIADGVIIQPGDELHYSEKIIRLPGSYQCNDDKRPTAARRPRKDFDLPDDAVVFCAFCQANRITPEMFDVWLDLLAHVERSVLWLLAPNAEAQQSLRTIASARGIDGSRIIFAPKLPHPEHLARLAHADLALDSFPWGSHTTASDMLWCGVPLIGMRGDTFASRVSASLLTAAGMPDLIATSRDAYREMALRFGSDRAALAGLKSRAQQCRSSPLFDTARFARNLETAYETIWRRHLAGEPPDHVAISDGQAAAAGPPGAPAAN